MKKTFKNFTLYVTKKDDTLESIAQKFNCEVDDIYRYNKLIRYHNIFPGMPLHIAIPEVEERTSNNENLDIFSPSFIFDNIWYYRTSLIACLYTPFSAEILIQEEKNCLHNLFSSFSNQETIKTQLESCLSYLHHSNYILAKCIEKNVMSTLKNEMERKKQKCAEYKKYLLELMTSNEWGDLIENLFNIDLKWQTFILRYATKKAKEAENLFKTILEKEISFYQTLTHFLMGQSSRE